MELTIYCSRRVVKIYHPLIHFTKTLLTDILFIKSSRKTLLIFLKTPHIGYKICEETMRNMWSSVFPFCNIQNNHGNLKFLLWNIIEKSLKIFKACLWEPWIKNKVHQIMCISYVIYFSFSSDFFPQVPPTITQPLGQNEAIKGQQTTVECRSQAKPDAKYEFFRVNNIIVVAHCHEGISNHLQVGCLFHSVSILATKGVSKLQNSGSWSGEWASCQIVKLQVAHVPGMTGIFSPPPLVSDPDMHCTCVTCAVMHAKIAN